MNARCVHGADNTVTGGKVKRNRVTEVASGVSLLCPSRKHECRPSGGGLLRLLEPVQVRNGALGVRCARKMARLSGHEAEDDLSATYQVGSDPMQFPDKRYGLLDDRPAASTMKFWQPAGS
jgi:hypothetical protein